MSTRQEESASILAGTEGTRYSVGVYNAMVRALVGEMDDGDIDTVEDIDAQWANLRHQEVVAASADQARSLVQTLYPPTDGYVVTEVRAVGGTA